MFQMKQFPQEMVISSCIVGDVSVRFQNVTYPVLTFYFVCAVRAYYYCSNSLHVGWSQNEQL